MLNQQNLNSNNYSYTAAISDGELLNELNTYKHKLLELTSRQVCSGCEAKKIRNQIEVLKALLTKTIEELERVGYACNESRLLI